MPFASDKRIPIGMEDIKAAHHVLVDETNVNQEVLAKTKALESKLDYQIKKLVGLAEAEKTSGSELVEDITQGRKPYQAFSLPRD